LFLVKTKYFFSSKLIVVYPAFNIFRFNNENSILRDDDVIDQRRPIGGGDCHVVETKNIKGWIYDDELG
jgi:hypothetical protein